MAAEPGVAQYVIWGEDFVYEFSEDAEFHAGLKISVERAGLRHQSALTEDPLSSE
jgi:hypothetical protein